MKKLLLIALAVSILSVCGPKSESVEKIFEDGIEVVVNHLEPYMIEGEPSTLHLEEEFTIDTEDEEMLGVGLTDIESFDVDAGGHIYIIQWLSQANHVFKFGPDGRFLISFVRSGHGPGELTFGGLVLVNPRGEIMVKDPSLAEFLIYDRDGNFLREKQLGKNFSLRPLNNGSYFITWQIGDRNPEFYLNYVGICDANFEEKKDLDVLQWANPSVARYEVNGNRMIHGNTFDKIYVGHSKRGYELHVYDSGGNLLRKIRKDYKPVKVSEEYKQAFFDRYPANHPYRKNCYFTNSWPPFRYLFFDDEGRLFVMTYEEGDNPGEYFYDIFNSGGVFIGRTKLDNMEDNRPTTAKAKNNRLFYLRVKDSGYKELVVLKMRWE